MKDKLAELFASLTAASQTIDKNHKIELCSIKNEEIEVLIPFKDDLDLIRKIKLLKVNNALSTEIMITYLSSSIFDFINKNFKEHKIVAFRNESKLESDYKSKEFAKKVKEYSDAIILRETFRLFLEKNTLFSDFIKKYYSNSRNSTVINEMTNNSRVLFYNADDNQFKFTSFGKLLFSSENNIYRKISILTYSDNLRFINEQVFDLPLVKWTEDIAEYIYKNISSVQIRGGILSFQGKTIALKTIQNVLLYCIINHDFSNSENIEVRIYPISISISFSQKQGENAVKAFFGKFEDINTIIKSLTMIEDDIHVFKKKRGSKKIIELISYGKNENYNPILNEIEYKILDYASEVDAFTRNDIEKLLKGYISTRSIIYYLNRLIDYGYLKRTGMGKSYKYSLK